MKLIILTDKQGNEHALEIVKMKSYPNAGYIEYVVQGFIGEPVVDNYNRFEIFWTEEKGFSMVHPFYDMPVEINSTGYAVRLEV